MSIFRNDNEKNYVGGRKHFTDVIKNQSSDDVFFFKCPEEDFNTNSTLIVMPGEEAFFVKDGEIVANFVNGKYKLDTNNYPFISRLKNMFSGGISTFNCLVYYVRKTVSKEILWGTDSPIVLRDPVLGIATKMRSRGAYKVTVDNPKKYVEFYIARNVGSGAAADTQAFFQRTFLSIIKNTLANAITESKTELLNIQTKTLDIADMVKDRLQPELASYGLACNSFSIMSIDIEDSELRNEYDKIGMDAYKKRVAAMADKDVMNILGDDWDRQKKADIMMASAQNPNGNNMGTNIAVGMMAYNSMTKDEGLGGSSSKDDIKKKLKELKELLDDDLITQADYDAKKSELLSKM